MAGKEKDLCDLVLKAKKESITNTTTPHFPHPLQR